MTLVGKDQHVGLLNEAKDEDIVHSGSLRKLKVTVYLLVAFIEEITIPISL